MSIYSIPFLGEGVVAVRITDGRTCRVGRCIHFYFNYLYRNKRPGTKLSQKLVFSLLKWLCIAHVEYLHLVALFHIYRLISLPVAAGLERLSHLMPSFTKLRSSYCVEWLRFTWQQAAQALMWVMSICEVDRNTRPKPIANNSINESHTSIMNAPLDPLRRVLFLQVRIDIQLHLTVC